ncbi:hypothetical protein ACQCT5_17175 [Sutcliffiella halmapala]
MKNLCKIITTSMLVFTLGACSSNETVSKSNTVSVHELSEKENAILSTTSDKSFIFNFKVDDEYKEVRVWIEKYESGVLVDDRLNLITTEGEENGSIIFATSKKDNSQKPLIFNIGISSDGSTSSISSFDTDSVELDNMASTWSHIPEKITQIEGELVLASICYSSNGEMTSLTQDFYKDVDAHMNELEKYDVVYLLKTEFIN